MGTWTTDSFSPVTQYKVYYRKSPLDSVSAPSDTGDWLQSFLTVTTPQSHLTTTSIYTLRDMDNQSVYDVKVRASNKYGMSEFSPVFNFYVKTAVGDAHKDFASPRFLQKEPKEVASSSSSSGDILSPDAEPICVSVLTLVYVLYSH